MMKIVVVEDEMLVKKGLILTTDWLKFNCEVVGDASNGMEGIDVIKRMQPDIVITDVRMPGLDGIKMIEALKTDCCKSEFIIISGYSEFEYARQAVKLGVRDFLVKPIDDEDLENALKNTCQEIHNKKVISKIQNKMEDITDSRVMLFKEYIIKEQEDNSDYTARAVRYINQNYQKDISLKSAADHLFISESYLSRVFKTNAGQTFGDYLTYYRIKMACGFLKEPDAKIHEIAKMIGYKDQRYFSVIFKKLVGLKPKEFRDKLN
ncbi:MAG: response regulator containing CheY-like receiver domain and AraC-type DNA-binding domain [Clostridia bacterium]|jgi:two-component system response regulator YesN|nr:response regulator containing CheY-like receiver domain and AraC-type DNA-binding domain [Clostridia bacterium]